MMRCMFVWVLCWNVVKNADITTNVFRVFVQRGDIPDRTVECAATCSQEVTCVGFDVSANQCTLLKLPNAEPQDGHTLYLSENRIKGKVPPCTPIAARKSNDDTFYTFFSASDIVPKFSVYGTDDMVAGNVVSIDTIRGDYPQLVNQTIDAAFRYDGDMHFIQGGNMAVFTYDSSEGFYVVITPHYPRSLEEEMGDVPIPSFINAADVNDSTLYLLQGNTVYSYNIDGYTPDISYQFLRQFDMTQNSDLNPFSAGPGSALARPPSWITAMVFCDEDKLLLAYSYRDIYLYSPGYWEYIGVVFTPCDV